MGTDKSLVKGYIEPELKAKFKKICDLEKRSESNMIEYLINNMVKEYEAKQERENRKQGLERSSISKTG